MSPSSLSITPGLRVAPGYLHFSRLAPYLLIMSCAAGEVMTVWLCSIASMALHASTLLSRCSWRLVPVYCFLLRMKSIPLSLFTSPLCIWQMNHRHWFMPYWRILVSISVVSNRRSPVMSSVIISEVLMSIHLKSFLVASRIKGMISGNRDSSS